MFIYGFIYAGALMKPLRQRGSARGVPDSAANHVHKDQSYCSFEHVAP